MCCRPWSCRVGYDLVTEQSIKSGTQSFHSLVISIPGNRKALLLQNIITLVKSLWRYVAETYCWCRRNSPSIRWLATPWSVTHQVSLSLLCPKVCPSSRPLSWYHLILCHPLLLLPSIFPSIRVFSNEPVLCIRWPKYWSFNLYCITPVEHRRI